MLVGRRFAIRRLPIFVGYFEFDDVSFGCCTFGAAMSDKTVLKSAIRNWRTIESAEWSLCHEDQEE